MKRKLLSLVLLDVIFILYSWGGVVGNIEKYPQQNINSDRLKAALNNVYNKYPELIKTDTALYGKNNGEDFYFLLNNGEGEGKVIFYCNIIVYSAPYNKETDLSLTSAATWGQTMQLAPKIGFLKKGNINDYLKRISYQK